MRLKMLIGISGKDFNLVHGEETERFSVKEAKRLIAAGHAEKAPPIERKKPDTKQEWDAERAALLAENEQLKGSAAEAAAREADLSAKLEALAAFHGNIASALQGLSPVSEATDKPADRETRG